MSEFLTKVILSSPAMRRAAWRLSRKLYSVARGEEQIPDVFEANGEGYVQDCALKALPQTGAISIVDIGANRGDWSASILERLPAHAQTSVRTRLDLFEPAPLLIEKLRSRIASLDKAGIAHLHTSAVSDTSGAAQLAVMSEHGGTNSLSFDASTAKQAIGIVDVPTLTLTEFCDATGIQHVHLAKSDTEGHDLKVLRGARGLLKQGRLDVFQFEYNHRWILGSSFLKNVFDLVEDLPYRVARIQPRFLEVFETWHPELERFFQSNYVLVREPSLKLFDCRYCKFDDSNTYA